MKFLLQLLAATIFLWTNVIISQESTSSAVKRIYKTKSIGEGEPPIINGELNDATWNIVEWQTDFIENEPDENTPPNQQTKFKILYDKNYLYIAIFALDKVPDSIDKRLSRRDGFVGDRVNVVIDSYNDKRTAFIFTVTAAGVKGEEFATDNGSNIDAGWNPIWYTKTTINSQGWVAEMKVPFSQLRFGKAKEQVWGFNISRTIFRKNERSVWNRIPVDAPGWISESGELHGLKNIKAQKQLEIQPFTVTQLETYPAEAGNPFRDGNDFKFNKGIDAKIGITNDLTLDLTVNPDFGQVEADPGAISLDGFEIFFREQRPFFVENNNIFDYNFGGNQDNLFFSRRIGRSPQGYPTAPIGASVNKPVNTTILGAVKFSGKTKNGWSIGVLESVTNKEYAEIDNNGTKSRELVEPLTNYFVGRVQKDFNNKNSYIGGIFTATNRNLKFNLNFLRKEAYTTGLDFKHQWKERNYFIDGYLIASHVKGSKEAITKTQMSLTHLFQRVDTEHVSIDTNKTSLTGTGGKFTFGKAGGGNWTYNGGIIWRSPELELNDIGFLRQADEIRQFFNLGYKTLKPFGAYRSISSNFQQFTTYDFEGNYNRIQYQIRGRVEFNSTSWINIGLTHKPRIYSNTMLRGGPRWRFSEENAIFSFLGTDSRKKLRAFFGLIYSGAKQNHFSFFRIESGITYQPTNALKISISPNFSNNPNKTQYVAEKRFNGTPRYILGTIDNKTISASLRLNYIINPDLSIQFYGQPFISRGNYSNFKYVNNPIADDLNDRFNQYDNTQISFDNASGSYIVDEDIDGNTDYSFRKPDFSFVQFRSNLVVRWEYIPGSEIFLVWSQGITSFTDPSNDLFNGLRTGILDQKPENIFLLKMTYRFVL
jgi:uncharacterized protein DUF5916/cellulose/xylan binding protein with CBM9 domain